YGPATNFTITPTIQSGSYTSASGLITITPTSSINGQMFPGGYMTLSALGGTGIFASLAGTWQILSFTAAGNILLQGPVGLGAGSLNAGTMAGADRLDLTLSTNLDALHSDLRVGQYVDVRAFNGTGSFAALNVNSIPIVSIAGNVVSLQGPRN